MKEDALQKRDDNEEYTDIYLPFRKIRFHVFLGFGRTLMQEYVLDLHKRLEFKRKILAHTLAIIIITF